MNRAEVHELLTQAASLDGRQVADADVLAWHEVLRDVATEDAQRALVTHYTTSERRITPAMVRQLVAAARSRRISGAVDLTPDVDPDDVPGYVRAIADRKAALADGRLDLPALPRRSVPPPAAITERARRQPTAIEALAVRCPWCAAARGERCTVPGTTRPLTGRPVHPARQEAAQQQETA